MCLILLYGFVDGSKDGLGAFSAGGRGAGAAWVGVHLMQGVQVLHGVP